MRMWKLFASSSGVPHSAESEANLITDLSRFSRAKPLPASFRPPLNILPLLTAMLRDGASPDEVKSILSKETVRHLVRSYWVLDECLKQSREAFRVARAASKRDEETLRQAACLLPVPVQKMLDGETVHPRVDMTTDTVLRILQKTHNSRELLAGSQSVIVDPFFSPPRVGLVHPVRRDSLLEVKYGSPES